MTTENKPNSTGAQDHVARFENIGPIEDFSFRFKEPGVYVLKGENGSGKTHALNTAKRALSGDQDVTVPLRDGATRGFFSLDDAVLLKVGKSNRNTGQADLSLVTASPLSQLVEPGIKDPDAAETARLKALLQMVECVVTEGMIETLVQSDKNALKYIDAAFGIADLQQMDIVTATDRVRRLVHELKRDFEQVAQWAEGEALAAAKAIPEIEADALSDLSVPTAQAQHETAVRHLERVSGEAAQRAKQVNERAEIESTLGERPNVEAARSYLIECADTADAERDNLDTLHSEMAALQARLTAKREEVERLVQVVRHAENAAAETNEAAANWDRRKENLGTEITGATQADVDAANVKLEAARTDLESARISADFRRSTEAKIDAERRQVEAQEKATRYEALATQVPAQLTHVFADMGISGLTIDDGRLCVVHTSGVIEPFARLSLGERTRIACEIRALRPTAGNVLAIDDKFWNALDPENRKEVAQIFHDRGLYALTEQAAAGVLRVEQFEAEVAA